MRRVAICVLISLLVACAPNPIPPADVDPTSPPATVTTIPTAITAMSSPTSTLTAIPATPVTELDLPDDQWTQIEAGGDTLCALGTPYSFWVRPGVSDDLLLYFEPGGGCWSAETCAPGSTFYDSNIDAGDHPDSRSGIFDLDHAENPFADYTMVYIPVCTGDVHMGDNVQTYTAADGSQLEVAHKGFVNASAALDWVYKHIIQPGSIFVAGCSAGSPGSMMHVPYIIEHYPDVPLAQLGDSLAFVFHRPVELQEDYGAHDHFPDWIPGLSNIAPGEFLTAEFYTIIANHYSDYRFGQYNTLHDSVQQRFYVAVGGDAENWVRDLEGSLTTISDHAPNYYTFTAGGSEHCIYPRSSFYRVAVDGVRFRDWLIAYRDGAEVNSLRCTDCDSPEYTE